jgi:hypothetical protein
MNAFNAGKLSFTHISVVSFAQERRGRRPKKRHRSWTSCGEKLRSNCRASAVSLPFTRAPASTLSASSVPAHQLRAFARFLRPPHAELSGWMHYTTV